MSQSEELGDLEEVEEGGAEVSQKARRLQSALHGKGGRVIWSYTEWEGKESEVTRKGGERGNCNKQI